MITSGVGRKQKLVFRYQRTDAEEGGGGPAAGRGRRAATDEEPIKLDKPLLLFTTDDTTKATGYYKVAVPPIAPPAAETKAKKPGGKATKVEAAPAVSATVTDPVKLVMMDKLVGGFVKAKNADTVVITEQRFDEVPEPLGDGHQPHRPAQDQRRRIRRWRSTSGASQS